MNDTEEKMARRSLEPQDLELLEAAKEAIASNFEKPRHTVGAAVRCASGKIFAGVNVETCGYGPCAEPVAIGSAVTAGERDFVAIVAVGSPKKGFPVIPPCGNCRQLLADYAPEAAVILPVKGEIVKVRAGDLIPEPYRNFEH